MSVTTKASKFASIAFLAGGVFFPLVGGGAEWEPVAKAIAQDPDCLRCHEPIREQIARPVPHEPAFDEDCALCHDPHAARFEHLLNVRERTLCFTCHREQRTAFQTGSIHTPVREGQCVVCHEVHGSEHAGLLVAEGNELCFSCHTDKQESTRLPTVHEPFAEGDCSDCHDPHNSPHADQLMAPSSRLCGLCHDPEDEDLVASHSDIPIAGSRCTRCHDAHASIEDGLLLPVTHEPFADSSCEMCHLVDGPSPRLVRATGGRLCGVCHKDYPRSEDTVVHQPVGEGNCGACHDPHATRTANLMVADLETTCLACHAELEERANTSKSAHPTSFDDGSSCDACHRPHSMMEEYLLTAGPIRTCLVCHESQRHGHPLGDDRIDPRTGKSITCVTCHDPHGTDFAAQLRGDQTRGLCLECHQSD